MAKKNELVTIDTKHLPVIEWEGVRVVTTETLAAGYGTSEANIRVNLKNHRSRFIEGEHVYTLKGDELRALRNQVKDIYLVNKHTNQLTLWTEKGAARISKIVDTDEAWSFFEKMEDAYFRQRKAAPLQTELSRLELIKMALESEQNYLAEKERADHAELTKSQISQKREATALQRISAYQRVANRAKRERDELAAQFGASKEWASTQQVWRATTKHRYYRPLARWCDEHDLQDMYCFDPITNDYVLCFPHGAWLEVYGVDIAKLF
ncbi:ORF6N domain-containing protein [Xenorhabdus bovienii]|uniref:KilA-N DNA-binding domain-containing protein n=1 Tax=Xenorhabdus bovienii str. Intermedium TaxID=1379677 RepID=A0A077QJ16_XENBV|nr:ORF6N domain-containing protein [Xenorhabdus bovienii]CDH33235.1 conserved hypothetical protein [Xenorhabdus bovienii str. Intermedium]